MKAVRTGCCLMLGASALFLAPPTSIAAPHWQGLHVLRESLDSIEKVNGVPMRIERFTGGDVPELLRHWLSEWRADEGTVAMGSGSSGDWRLYSRLRRPFTQEVLQARGKGHASELLWSSIPVSARQPVASAPAGVPAGCRAGPGVQGRDAQGTFEMYSAVCWRPPESLRSVSCDLKAAGTALCIVPLPGMPEESARALIYLRRPTSGAR
jgi:hypothetical protein